LTASANGISMTDSLQLLPASTSLSGTPGQHEVDLSWNAPTSSDNPVAGYYIYRAVGNSTAFSLLGSLDAQTSYADSNVASGTSYGYQVRTVDTSGNLSAPSDTAYVAVP
jgi:fibronectin type 3 domain-containing protein